MTATVGTSKSFNLPVDEIIEMALEGIGGEKVSQKEAKLARTALNLVFIDMQNRGTAPLSSLELTSVALVSGSSQNYPLGSAVFNVQPEAVVQVSSSGGGVTDLGITLIDHSEWLRIPNKVSAFGRPTQVFIDRQGANTFASFWPVPNSNQFSFKAWTLSRIADVTQSYQLVDLPHRYLPAVVKGLRYYMADLRGIPLEERAYLKQEYYETLQLALDEDRERVPFDLYPDWSIR